VQNKYIYLNKNVTKPQIYFVASYLFLDYLQLISHKQNIDGIEMYHMIYV